MAGSSDNREKSYKKAKKEATSGESLITNVQDQTENEPTIHTHTHPFSVAADPFFSTYRNHHDIITWFPPKPVEM